MTCLRTALCWSNTGIQLPDVPEPSSLEAGCTAASPTKPTLGPGLASHPIQLGDWYAASADGARQHRPPLLQTKHQRGSPSVT